MMKNLILFGLVGLLVGCLKTRNDLKDSEQQNVMGRQVSNLQKANNDVGNRFAELEEQIRELNGKVEVHENRLSQSSQGVDAVVKNQQLSQQEIQQKLNLYQEALAKLESQVFQLTAEVQELKSQKEAAPEKTSKASEKSDKGSYREAEAFFDSKEWKKAILTYQKYRDENPKGKNFADATYKIGVSFQELGLKDEAKTFYDEVLAKFPKSDAARKAKTRIKAMK